MRIGFVIFIAALGGCKARDKPVARAVTTAAAATPIEPWLPVDEGFKGCEGG